MNNDLEQFSEERLKELASTPEKYDHRYTCNMLNGDESRALARIALAAKQAKAIGYVESKTTGTGRFILKGFYEQNINIGDSLYTTPQPAHTEQMNSPVIPYGWIKCSERMPKVGDVVLTAHQGATNIGEMERSGRDYRYFTSIASGRELPADFWMPLPAAPKPESE